MLSKNGRRILCNYIFNKNLKIEKVNFPPRENNLLFIFSPYSVFSCTELLLHKGVCMHVHKNKLLS